MTITRTNAVKTCCAQLFNKVRVKWVREPLVPAPPPPQFGPSMQVTAAGRGLARKEKEQENSGTEPASGRTKSVRGLVGQWEITTSETISLLFVLSSLILSLTFLHLLLILFSSPPRCAHSRGAARQQFGWLHRNGPDDVAEDFFFERLRPLVTASRCR